MIRKCCEFDHLQSTDIGTTIQATVVTESPTLSNKIRKPLSPMTRSFI